MSKYETQAEYEACFPWRHLNMQWFANRQFQVAEQGFIVKSLTLAGLPHSIAMILSPSRPQR